MTRMIRTTSPDATPTIPCTLHDRWRADRLREARGILATGAEHPDTRLILAARVVVAHSADARECADAVALWRMLDRRPLHARAAAASPKGGAA